MQQHGRFFRESHSATVEFVLDSHWSQDCNDRFRHHDPGPAGPKAPVVGHRVLGNLRHFHHSGTHQVLQLGRQGCQLWFPRCNPAGQDQANMSFTMSFGTGNQHHHHVATPDDVGSGTEIHVLLMLYNVIICYYYMLLLYDIICYYCLSLFIIIYHY